MTPEQQLALAHECAVRRLVAAGHYRDAMVAAWLTEGGEVRSEMAVAAIDAYREARDLCRLAADAIKAREDATRRRGEVR